MAAHFGTFKKRNLYFPVSRSLLTRPTTQYPHFRSTNLPYFRHRCQFRVGSGARFPRHHSIRCLSSLTAQASSKVTGGSNGAMCALAGSHSSDTAAAEMTSCQLRQHFVTSMLPMVGFGFMDNVIMIQAGEAVDMTLGVTFGLSTLTAAAVGQIFSDVSGVCFGGCVSSLALRLGFYSVLSAAQQQTAKARYVATAGRIIGVIMGCLMGMTSLCFMNLEESHRLRRLKDVHPVLSTVVQRSKRALGATSCRVFLLDRHNDERVMAFYEIGASSMIRHEVQQLNRVNVCSSPSSWEIPLINAQRLERNACCCECLTGVTRRSTFSANAGVLKNVPEITTLLQKTVHYASYAWYCYFRRYLSGESMFWGPKKKTVTLAFFPCGNVVNVPHKVKYGKQLCVSNEQAKLNEHVAAKTSTLLFPLRSYMPTLCLPGNVYVSSERRFLLASQSLAWPWKALYWPQQLPVPSSKSFPRQCAADGLSATSADAATLEAFYSEGATDDGSGHHPWGEMKRLQRGEKEHVVSYWSNSFVRQNVLGCYRFLRTSLFPYDTKSSSCNQSASPLSTGNAAKQCAGLLEPDCNIAEVGVHPFVCYTANTGHALLYSRHKNASEEEKPSALWVATTKGLSQHAIIRSCFASTDDTTAATPSQNVVGAMLNDNECRESLSDARSMTVSLRFLKESKPFALSGYNRSISKSFNGFFVCYPIFAAKQPDQVIGVIQVTNTDSTTREDEKSFRHFTRYLKLFVHILRVHLYNMSNYREDERLVRMLSEHISLYIAMGSHFDSSSRPLTEVR